MSETNDVDCLVMSIYQSYEDGDPAAPGDRFATFSRGETVVAEMIFHNEDNEDIEIALTEAVKDMGGDVVTGSNVNNHYYS